MLLYIVVVVVVYYYYLVCFVLIFLKEAQKGQKHVSLKKDENALKRRYRPQTWSEERGVRYI